MRFLAADGHRLPFRDDAFDVVLLQSILHHADAPEQMVREALRVAPRVVVHEPNGNNLGLKVIERVSKYHLEHGERSYTPRRVGRWVSDAGGAVVSCRFAGFVPMFCPDFRGAADETPGAVGGAPAAGECTGLRGVRDGGGEIWPGLIPSKSEHAPSARGSSAWRTPARRRTWLRRSRAPMYWQPCTSRCLRIDPAAPEDEGRDRFILSKGHGCMALYAALAERGFFPEEVLEEYARDGGRLAEHPAPRCVPGIEVATGSLGHGLSLGAGLALAAKIREQSYRVFVLLSDAECAEGSVWEAALFARARGLDNLVAVVDYNKWSAMGRTSPYLEPLAEKWRAFGWSCVEIDGHDAGSIVAALSRAPFEAVTADCGGCPHGKGQGRLVHGK